MKLTALILLTLPSFYICSSEAAKISDLFDYKVIEKQIKEKVANYDVNFDQSLGNIDLIDGLNLSNVYRYNVEASYKNKFYTRIDKWDINAGINVGEVVKELVDIPFSFSVNRQSSFFFVRQFSKKREALLAIPYGPNKLPLKADLALKNLKAGDFVSMPANMNIAVGTSLSTTSITPVILNANASTYFVISGEFTIQVFKIDDTHVRLKLISKNGRDSGGVAGIGVSFNVFGVRIVDQAIDRLLERNLVELGISYNPGSQFIIDYIFNLADEKAKNAYDQIMSSTFKFKDILVGEQILDAKDLKDKLISSYEAADDLYEQDKNLEISQRRISRIFKGFNNYSGHSRHLKLSLLLASMTKDKTFNENKVTFIDKNEKSLAFYYPTFSKYYEGHYGLGIFQSKDQSFQNNFGLLPQFTLEDGKVKNPDIGLTFERKDRNFTTSEQKTIEEFLIEQIPAELVKEVDLSEWKNGELKNDTRIFFQLVLKSRAFNYLRNLSAEDLRKNILKFYSERKKIHVIDNEIEDLNVNKLKDFFLIDKYIQKERLLTLADSLAEILQDKTNNSEQMLTRLIALNEQGDFDTLGLGFLISLVPQDKLLELVYLKLEMFGKDLKPISKEIGTLNYVALYKELNEIQSRLSNRSYDLQITDQDRSMSDIDITGLEDKTKD